MPRRSIQLNLLILYGAEVAAKLVGVWIFGYLGRILLADRYGDLEFAIAILFVLNLVMEAGLTPYGAREAARTPARTTALAGHIALIRAGVVVAAWLVLGALWLLLPATDPVARLLVLLYGIVLLPGPFLLNWVFQSRDEMGVVAGCSLLRQVTMALGVKLFVHEPDDVVLVPLCDATGFLLAVGVQQVLFRVRIGALRPLAFVRGTAAVWRGAMPIALSSIVWALRLFAPTLALWAFVSSSATAVFGAGHRLVIAVHTFVWLYFFNLLPSLSRAAHASDRDAWRRLIRTSLRLVSWVALYGSAAGTVLAPEIIPRIYGPHLAAGAAPFALMGWMLTLAFLSGHYSYSLIAFDRQRDQLIASIAGCVVAVGACLALGASLTPVRAAVVFVASELATLIAVWLIVAWRLERVPLAPALLRPLGATVLGLGAVQAVAPGAPFRGFLVLSAVFLVSFVGFESRFVREILRGPRA